MKQISNSHLRWPKGRRSCVKYISKERINNESIDAYFDYKLGTLEYRSVRFETETLDKPNFQGNAAVNYTDRETPWTRIILKPQKVRKQME